MFEVRHAVGQRQQLVDLLLILREYELRFAVVEEIGRLVIQHVAVKPEAQPSDRVCCDLGCDPVGAVVADDADDIAAAEPQLDHAEREILHAGLVVVPGEQPPQAEILFAERDLVAVLLRVEAQQLWIGVGLRDAGGVIHHAALSVSGLSSGSTSTSSSSPR